MPVRNFGGHMVILNFQITDTPIEAMYKKKRNNACIFLNSLRVENFPKYFENHVDHNS